ncbi:hypothetical protein TI03_06770, partial [Achromatium sp. WMS1]
RCGSCHQVFDAQREEVTLGPPVLPAYATNANDASDIISAAPNPHDKYWILGVLLLFLVLPIQWLWWERAWLATVPKVEPIVTTICRYLPCDLQPLHALAKIRILERSLQADPNNPHIMHFRLRMTNEAPGSQPFPLLDLKLFDTQLHIIGQRRFNHQQYLTSALHSSVMLPNQEVQVALDLINPQQQGLPGFEINFR